MILEEVSMSDNIDSITSDLNNSPQSPILSLDSLHEITDVERLQNEIIQGVVEKYKFMHPETSADTMCRILNSAFENYEEKRNKL